MTLDIERGCEETLVSEPPGRLRVDTGVDGEGLPATVDDGATVVEVRR